MSPTTEELHQKFEPNPDPSELTGHGDKLPHNVSKDIDYEPHPENSINVSEKHQAIINSITSLYSGSCSEDDMQVYAKEAMYISPLR